MQIIDRKRLIADENKILVNGEMRAKVVDCAVEEVELWVEEEVLAEEVKAPIKAIRPNLHIRNVNNEE